MGSLKILFMNCLLMSCFRIIFVDSWIGDCLIFFLVIMGYGLFDFFCVLGLGWQVVQYWADGHALT